MLRPGGGMLLRPADVPDLSIVIPTLNEEQALVPLLRDLARLTATHEAIVVDGGSSDRTCQAARAAGARVIRSNRGRGVQLRAGAELARAPLLLFLHADVRLTREAVVFLEEIVANPPREAVAFRLGINAPGRMYRVIEWGANLRSRLVQMPYGDQGLMLRREEYLHVGGYPPVPLMEDVMIVRRLRRTTGIRISSAAVQVSGRRWQADGLLRRMLGNWLLMARFILGETPASLDRHYPPSGTARKRIFAEGDS